MYGGVHSKSVAVRQPLQRRPAASYKATSAHCCVGMFSKWDRQTHGV